ncbi:MAG TPA: hypothetical protein VHB21_05890 [Minicystis sp.]|nr:hypothetical protein [Minicystis sp.]
MAHNLHDKNGLYVIGVDGHMGLHIFPPAPGFFIELTAVHPFAMGSNFHPTVQFNGGTPSVTDQHVSKFLWPHIPIEPPDNVLFPIDVLTGSQKTWLPRLQVLINGTPAAPTVFPGMLSINVNCWAFGFLPTNLVIQPGTVQTTPTGADYAYGAIRWAVDTAISVLLFVATAGKGGDAEEEEETILSEEIQKAISQQLFKAPTGAKGAYGLFTSATGFDPGQAVASAVVGQGPGSSIGFNAQSALGKVSPISGELYSAQNVGH